MIDKFIKIHVDSWECNRTYFHDFHKDLNTGNPQIITEFHFYDAL